MSKMKLLFLVVVLVQGTATVNGCEYSRKGGYFANSYMDPYVQAMGDFDSNQGHTIAVQFSQPFRVFSDSDGTILTISDHGRIFAHGAVPTGLAYPGHAEAEYDLAGDSADSDGKLFRHLDTGFIASYWLQADAAIGYEFTYRHLTRDVVTDGLTKGGSLCDIQRFETIISDCKRENYESGADIVEMLIVTHHWHMNGGNDNLYSQSIIGVDGTGHTYVVFIYEDELGDGNEAIGVFTGVVDIMGGLINGNYDTATASSWAHACTTYDELHKESNCLCNTWNAGVYMFDVKVNPVIEQTHGCTENYFSDTACFEQQSAPEDYFPLIANPNCMQAVLPTDSCHEQAYCQASSLLSDSVEVTLTLVDPKYSEVTFVDPDAFPATLNRLGDPACSKTLDATGRVSLSIQTTSLASGSFCGVKTVSGTQIKFTVRNYDSEFNGLFREVGERVITVVCDYEQLPVSMAQTLVMSTHGSVTIQAENTQAGLPVNFFVSITKDHDDDTNVQPSSSVFSGQDLFLTICLDYGSDDVVLENTEPYGVYAFDCVASKDNTFATTTVDMIDSDGCPIITNKDQAFYVEDSFKHVTSTGTNAHWCISTGRFDAAKWFLDADDTIHFRCHVNTCWNAALRDNGLSRCEDSCNGDPDSGITKRDVHSNNTMTLETSVRIIREEEPVDTDDQCIDRTIAIATLVVNLIILLPVAGLSVVLFYKVYVTKED